MSELLITESYAGAVRRITLNRPEKRNAISRPMFAELTAAFNEEPPARERVTVIDAVGPTFCSGVDLSQRTEGGDSEGESPLERLCLAIHSYPLPVVAVLQGSAIGGGAMLAMHCDFVVAAVEAKIGNSAVQLGLVPAWPVTRHVLSAARATIAARMLLLGDLMPAVELENAGVIMAAVEAGALVATADAIVTRLARNAPLSLRAVKASLNARAVAPVPHEEVLQLIRTAQQSEDAVEGVRARKEKRTPVYLGR